MAVDGVSSEGRRLIASITLPFVLATVAFILRIISRTSSRKIGADDWCGIFAFVAYIALYITSLIWATHGYIGWPQQDLDDAQLVAFLKVSWVVELLYALLAPSVKLSFILLYSRTLDAKAIRVGLLVGIAAISAWFVATFFATILQCSPVHGYWSVDRQTLCTDHRALQLGTSSTNVILNVIIVLMPLPVIWRIDLKLAQKIIIFAMLGLGSMITIFSILRAFYLSEIDSANLSGTGVSAAVWTSVEPGMVIFCSSLPALLHMVLTYLKAARERRFSATSSRSDTEATLRHSVESKTVDLCQYEKVPDTAYDPGRYQNNVGHVRTDDTRMEDNNPNTDYTYHEGRNSAVSAVSAAAAAARYHDRNYSHSSHRPLYVPHDLVQDAQHGRYPSENLVRPQKEFAVYRFSGFSDQVMDHL